MEARDDNSKVPDTPDGFRTAIAAAGKSAREAYSFTLGVQPDDAQPGGSWRLTTAVSHGPNSAAQVFSTSSSSTPDTAAVTNLDEVRGAVDEAIRTFYSVEFGRHTLLENTQ
jgi:hypothetical protein